MISRISSWENQEATLSARIVCQNYNRISITSLAMCVRPWWYFWADIEEVAKNQSSHFLLFGLPAKVIYIQYNLFFHNIVLFSVWTCEFTWQTKLLDSEERQEWEGIRDRRKRALATADQASQLASQVVGVWRARAYEAGARNSSPRITADQPSSWTLKSERSGRVSELSQQLTQSQLLSFKQLLITFSMQMIRTMSENFDIGFINKPPLSYYVGNKEWKKIRLFSFHHHDDRFINSKLGIFA